jgi:hypothetical protein
MTTEATELSHVATENGDKAFTATNKCVDFFVRTTRSGMDVGNLLNDFCDAWAENPVLAYKMLMHMRDCRNGKGEKIMAILIMSYIKQSCDEEQYETMLKDFVKHGCWKDLFKIMHMTYSYGNRTKAIMHIDCEQQFIKKQLESSSSWIKNH